MADLEEKRKNLLSLLCNYEEKHTDSTNNPCTHHSKATYTIYQNHVYAQLFNQNEVVWAYMNNEYHRCKIIEIMHSKQSHQDHDDHATDDEFDENEATPPLTTTNIDNIDENEGTPPYTHSDDDCSTPEPTTSVIQNTTYDVNYTDGLCSSIMPIYRVLCLNPRYKGDIPCKHFIQNNHCTFNQNNKCLYSHGWLEPQDRLKKMDDIDIHCTLKMNDRCLAQWYEDKLWYKARIHSIHLMKNKTLYGIQFDHYPEDVYNVDKEMVVPYTSALDVFHDLHRDESITIHSNNNTDFGNRNMVQLSSSQFGIWQKHTTGIGFKYLMKYGYNIGDGLGINKQGRSEPVPIRKIKKNVGLDFVNQNTENHNKNNMNKTKKKKNEENINKKKRKLKNKRNKNVFETMNILFGGNNEPKKKKRRVNIDENVSKRERRNNELQIISELLFSLENEKREYKKKIMNTNDIKMKQHYNKFLKNHDMKIKKLKIKHNHTETKRNQDSMYDMENFKF